MLKIKNGIVIDHISVGKGIKIYEKLDLDSMEQPIILMRNIQGNNGKLKDVIKIENLFEIPLEFFGILDKSITVNYIKNEEVISKVQVTLPKAVKGIIKCKNPRCISFETEFVIPEFNINAKQDGYSCSYCEETTLIEQIEL